MKSCKYYALHSVARTGRPFRPERRPPVAASPLTQCGDGFYDVIQSNRVWNAGSMYRREFRF